MTANEFNATKFPKIEQNCYLIGGSEASLSIPDLKIWSYKETKDWRSKFLSKNLNFKYNNPFLDQINHFYDVITKGSKPIVSGQEGLESLKAIDAIQKSIKTKKIINL